MSNSIRSIFFSILIFATTAAAQTLSIGGTIRDQSGAFIAGAVVRLVTSQRSPVADTTSDADGNFRFDGIRRGSYILVVSATGFANSERTVTSNTSDLEITLSVDRLTEQVTVSVESGSAADRALVPIQVNVLGSDTIAQRTTGVLAQAAEGEVGISMQRTSPTIGAVLVRGLTEVGVYVDGVRFTNSTQRGGINTFFNLNESTALRSIEVQRSPNTAQYGSDGLGGNVQLLSRQPIYGLGVPRWSGSGEIIGGAADNSFGSNLTIGFASDRFGVTTNLVGRRINPLRPGRGIDSHSAITRFLGLPSNIMGSDRLPDTDFTQYGGTLNAGYSISANESLSFRYQRSQQDGGKRYDQLLGGDGNLVAELRNLMLDFGYVRYSRIGLGFFDELSANVSFNNQREERQNQGGNGNFAGAVTHDKERTTSWGTAMYLTKRLSRNDVLIGGDLYRDRVTAPSFNLDPASGRATQVRPRVPNGATYLLGGIYAQNVWNAIPERLRVAGSARYNLARYRSRAINAPIVSGQPLFPDDSATYTDISGRIGATMTIAKGLNAAFNFSRGFRAPNITSLGSLGLVGVGFQVSTTDIAGLGGTIGSTADANAVSTGRPVAALRSEISNNYDVSLRFNDRRTDLSVTGFIIDYGNTIVRQTLILPPGAVGTQLGSQTIISQNANGAVFVAASTSPVLVQANFNSSRMRGVEFSLDRRLFTQWTAGANFSLVHAEDRSTGEPPNLGGGGLPPAMANFRLRYQPVSAKFWVEAYAKSAGRQDRLSTLDLADRRTGAARSRAQIQNFFRRGACVRGITTAGTTGQCGAAGGVLVATGETLAQVQDRLLPIGATVNGVLIINNETAVPMFTAIPGYALFGIRGGIKIAEKHELLLDAKNLADRSHRLPGWGIDGPGRNLIVRYRFTF